MNSLLQQVTKICLGLMVISLFHACTSSSDDKKLEDISTTQEEAIKLSEVEEEAQKEDKSIPEEDPLEFEEDDLEITDGEEPIVAEESLVTNEKTEPLSEPLADEKGKNMQQQIKPAPPRNFAPANEGNCQNFGYNYGNCLFVKTSKANVRSGPSKESPVVRVLSFREFVRIFERSGKWIRISDKEWVSQKTLSAYLHKYRLKANAEVFVGPSDYLDVVRTVKKGELVEVQGIYGKWAQIGANEFILRRRLGKRQ